MRLFLAAAAVTMLAGCGGEAPSAAAATTVDSEPPPPGGWAVDKSASRLAFTATQTGEAFEGRFENFTASIVFDPDDLSAAHIVVAVDPASARTGDRQRDTALPGSDWFRTRDYPTARFESREVSRTGEGAYEARGALTMRDVTRDIALPFTLAIDGARARAEGGVTLIRTDWGVGQGEFATDQWVGTEVGVKFVIEATKAE